MKLVAKVKLRTDPAQSTALARTLRTANEACNWISQQAWKHQEFNQFQLHRLVYHAVRERFRLSAQVTVRSIAKVAAAYKADPSQRRTFRPLGAVAYDSRILSWQVGRNAVSIWTVAGRLSVAFAAGPTQLSLLRTQRGESDLLVERGVFYLVATCEVEEATPSAPVDVMGCDLGIRNIATDSDGKRHSGRVVERVRHRHRRLRQRLQKKQTRSAKRRLKRLAGQERRFARDVNHCISKQIVAEAKRTGRAIGLEDLRGLRSRVRAGRKQRAVLHSWAFSQLRSFIEYKAKRAGVLVILVDPRNTSRTCSRCGQVDKANRPGRELFRCVRCGSTDDADINAALVIRSRALVSAPYVASCAAA